MLFVELIVYLSTAIATLRASSRLLYILQHGDIGVMDGNLILDPTTNNHSTVNSTHLYRSSFRNQNTNDDLWDYTVAFKKAVSLSLNINDDSLVPENNHESNEKHNLDTTTKKNLLIRGLRLRLLNDLMKGAIDKSRPVWYHFCIDPLILGLLKWTSFPLSSRLNRDNVPKWDYDESVICLVNASQVEARVKAYSPNVFKDLRRRFGIDPTSFVQSIFLSGPFVSFQSNSKGALRSGGIFFFTRDGVFMIKTIKDAEMKSLQRILPKYHRYMMRNAKRSLLTRFCGLYGVQLLTENERKSQAVPLEKKKEQFFLVMNSVFPVQGKSFITERFDIKGSTVGRSCSQEELEKQKTSAILKDLDLIHSDQENYNKNGHHQGKLVLGERMKAALLDQLRHDVGLLISCDVMDYSLLMGIVPLDNGHKCSKDSSIPPSDSSPPTNLFRIIASPLSFLGGKLYNGGRTILSSILTVPFPYYGADLCGVDCGKLSRIEGQRHGQRALYYFGLIDFLQPWTFRKACEREMKGLVGYDKQRISCVHPRFYASRFLDFLDANIC